MGKWQAASVSPREKAKLGDGHLFGLKNEASSFSRGPALIQSPTWSPGTGGDWVSSQVFSLVLMSPAVPTSHLEGGLG